MINGDQPTGEFLLYTTEDGKSWVECRFENETLWLSQALMAELFDRDVRTISEHLQNLFEEEELAPEATIRKFRIVRQEGSRHVAWVIEHYNLEAILAVGFRVKSPRGTQFRRWANTRLQESLVKGFTMDGQRLRNPRVDGQDIPDYLDELLERIRDIRASERRNITTDGAPKERSDFREVILKDRLASASTRLSPNLSGELKVPAAQAQTTEVLT